MKLIKFAPSDFNLADLIDKTSGIIAALNGNANFPSLAAQVAATDAVRAALELKLDDRSAAETALSTAINEVNALRAQLETAMVQLASACEGVTLDPAKLANGGWVLRGAAAPVGPMPMPQNCHATTGDMEGTADVMWDPVPGARTYQARCATNPAGPWTDFYVGTASSTTATGLTSGQEYWFQVRAVGAAGPGPWSDPARKRAA